VESKYLDRPASNKLALFPSEVWKVCLQKFFSGTIPFFEKLRPDLVVSESHHQLRYAAMGTGDHPFSGTTEKGYFPQEGL
jgi:hypothetical protein